MRPGHGKCVLSRVSWILHREVAPSKNAGEVEDHSGFALWLTLRIEIVDTEGLRMRTQGLSVSGIAFEWGAPKADTSMRSLVSPVAIRMCKLMKPTHSP